MRHSDNLLKRHREHHPQVGFGLFLILLGVALLIATNDLLNLGGIREYFTWETAMIFIGVLLLLNMNFIGGILMIAAGLWFWYDDRYGYIPDLIKTIYWPVVIMSIGLVFIISSLIKRGRKE
jgi:hypothetical protein